jgi:dolichol-phosphate mannosyltransferase
MIVVDDDSPDGTSDLAFALASADCRMRCLRRVNRNGLAGAVVEGWMSSSADLVAVIDGDLQHDETILPGAWGRARKRLELWGQHQPHLAPRYRG